MTPSPTKGATTREAILARSYALACVNGLEGLTIGGVAEQVGMSKSGVFAHFGSREELQISVVREYHTKFEEEVFFPAMRDFPSGFAAMAVARCRWTFSSDGFRSGWKG